jgi:hypothetical protein
MIPNVLKWGVGSSAAADAAAIRQATRAQSSANPTILVFPRRLRGVN